MDFSPIFESFKKERIAAYIYQKSGRARFCDRITIGRNGKALFERFNYGEAAGLVFSMWGVCEENGVIRWADTAVAYSRKGEAPKRLTGTEADGLLFDASAIPWPRHAALKSWRAGGLSRLGMLFSGY